MDDPTAADDAQVIAWFHRDAGDAFEALSRKSRLVGDLARAVGLAACREERLLLWRITRITCELASAAFADLDD